MSEGMAVGMTLVGAVGAWTTGVRLVTTVVVPQLHEPGAGERVIESLRRGWADGSAGPGA